MLTNIRGVMRLSSWYVEGTSTTLALSATDGCTYERHLGLHRDAVARVAFVRDTLANILWRKISDGRTEEVGYINKHDDICFSITCTTVRYVPQLYKL